MVCETRWVAGGAQAAPAEPKRRGPPSASEPIEKPVQAPVPAESSAPAAESPPPGNGTGG